MTRDAWWLALIVPATIAAGAAGLALVLWSFVKLACFLLLGFGGG